MWDDAAGSTERCRTSHRVTWVRVRDVETGRVACQSNCWLAHLKSFISFKKETWLFFPIGENVYMKQANKYKNTETCWPHIWSCCTMTWMSMNTLTLAMWPKGHVTKTTRYSIVFLCNMIDWFDLFWVLAVFLFTHTLSHTQWWYDQVILFLLLIGLTFQSQTNRIKVYFSFILNDFFCHDCPATTWIMSEKLTLLLLLFLLI